MSRSPRSLRTVAAAALASGALAVGVLGIVTAGSSNAVDEACAPDARYLDPEGDVNDIALDPLPISIPLDPVLDPDGLDVREGWFSTNAAADTVTFHLKVTDLSDLQGGVRGTSEEWQIDFDLEGRRYYVLATRTLLQLAPTPGAFSESFSFGQIGTNGVASELKGDLTGSFDPDFDTIQINLRKADLTGSSPAQPVFEVGDVIDDVRVTTRRGLLILAPDADNARGTCAYVIDPNPPTATPTPTATTTVTASPTATATVTTTATTTATATATATATSTTTEPANRKPKIRKFAAKPLKGQGKARAGTPIRFKAIARDPDGDKLSYRWDLGDGTKKSGRKVFHTYAEEGQYRVFVVIRDGRGGVLRVRAFLRLGPEKK